MIPVASILVIPFVQGTTPANLLALALLFPPVALLLMSFDGARNFYKTLLWIAACFVAFTAVSQLALAGLTLRHLAGLELVDPLDKSVVLRKTLFTQTMYLFAGVTTFVFVRWFYRREWDRWMLAGAALLAAYGIYELCFFAIAQRPGDFLSNRTFGAGFHPGSWFQTISLGPILMQRLKSLTGEPAMYAFTILPFWIYALHTGRNKTQWFLFLSLLLTASTTAVLGIAVYLFARIAWFHKIDRLSVAAAAAFIVVAGLWALNVEVVVDAVDKVLVSKLTLASISGIDRYRSFEEGIRYFLAAPLTMQLFGVGWGYTRGSNMFTTLLINVGALGLAIAIAAFLYPIFKLGNDLRSARAQGGGARAARYAHDRGPGVRLPVDVAVSRHRVPRDPGDRRSAGAGVPARKSACVQQNAGGESSMIRRISAAGDDGDRPDAALRAAASTGVRQALADASADRRRKSCRP